MIGINEYRHSTESKLKTLTFAVNDARSFYHVLIHEFGYKPEHVKLLTDGAATKEKIESAFEGLRSTAKDEESLLVFFAGHGTPEGYLAPFDAKPWDFSGTALSVGWVSDRLHALGCRHSAVILDSCYSGELFRRDGSGGQQRRETQSDDSGGRGIPSPAGQTRGASWTGSARSEQPISRDIFDYLQGRVVCGMSAARATPAGDGGGFGEHSVFTAALLKELEERAGSDRPGDVFTFRELGSRVQRRVGGARGTDQIPDYGVLLSSDDSTAGDGEFVFFPTLDRMTLPERDAFGEYINWIKIARENIDQSELSQAERDLNRCRPFLRDWEWHFIKGQRQKELPAVGATSMTFSADGRMLATGGFDGAIKVWDAANGREILAVSGHESAVVGMGFSLDGRHLHSVAEDGNLKVWDLETGETVRCLEATSGAAVTAAAGPGGRLIALGTDNGRISILDVKQGEAVAAFDGNRGEIVDVAFSPDGKLLAVAIGPFVFKRSEVQIWRIENEELVRSLHAQDFDFTCISFHPEGRLLAAGGAYRLGDKKVGAIRVWDVDSGREFPDGGAAKSGDPTKHSAPVLDLEYSHNGQRLFSIADDMKVLHAIGGQEIVALPAGGRRLALAASGDFLAVAGPNSVQILDGRPDRELLALDDAANDVALSGDGRWLATASLVEDENGTTSHQVRVWNTQTGTFLYGEHQTPVRCVSFSRDGQLLASGADEGYVRVWNAITLEPLGSVRHQGSVADVAFSVDGGRIACVGGSDWVTIWNWASEQTVLTLRGHEDEVRCVAFSPDGKYIASGSEDRAIIVWDAENGQRMFALSGHTDGVSCVAFGESQSGVGHLLSGSYDGTVKLWQIPSGKETITFSEHEHPVWSVAVTGCPPVVASVDKGPQGTIHIWHGFTGERVLTLGNNQRPVRSVAISRDGRYVASAGLDDTVRLWNITDVLAFPETSGRNGD